MVRLKRSTFPLVCGQSPGAAVPDIISERCGEDVGPVTESVVGHHRRTLIPGVSEEDSGPSPERRCGLLAFVWELLGVGQPGVIVDGMVQEHVAA